MAPRSLPREKIARALRHLANEHGLPNAFSAGEIAIVGSLHALTVGSILSAFQSRQYVAVADACRRVGIELVAYGVHADGRSYATVAAAKVTV